MNILVAFRLVLPFRERKDFVRLSENKLNSIVFTTDKIIFFSKSQPGVFMLFVFILRYKQHLQVTAILRIILLITTDFYRIHSIQFT